MQNTEIAPDAETTEHVERHMPDGAFAPLAARRRARLDNRYALRQKRRARRGVARRQHQAAVAEQLATASAAVAYGEIDASTALVLNVQRNLVRGLRSEAQLAVEPAKTPAGRERYLARVEAEVRRRLVEMGLSATLASLR